MIATMTTKFSVLLLLATTFGGSVGFIPNQRKARGDRYIFLRHCDRQRTSFLFRSSQSGAEQETATKLDEEVASKFKVLTCSSTSCAAKRKVLDMDEYSTFSAFWTRIEDNAPTVQVEESPCLGACKKAPCVAIEHEEYEGTVSLEGMTDNEFSDRVFHRIITEEDADRVWSCVENAIMIMAEEEDEEGEDDDLLVESKGE